MKLKYGDSAIEKEYVDGILETKVRKDLHIIGHNSKPVYHFFKRAFDVISAFITLIVLSPIFVIVAILIKIDDRGPVIFKHYRMGRNGKPFGVYKFRSMKMGSEKIEDFLTPEQLEVYKKEFKLDNDPRITKIGNILRKTSMDELPQLINIIKGEMSVIGPRPILESEFEYYTAEEKALVLTLRPGLTGYWQAYARNDATYETGERQRMELYYAENASIWLDIKILFKSFTSVLSRKGAK